LPGFGDHPPDGSGAPTRSHASDLSLKLKPLHSIAYRHIHFRVGEKDLQGMHGKVIGTTSAI
jgi:hypothetical protein